MSMNNNNLINSLHKATTELKMSNDNNFHQLNSKTGLSRTHGTLSNEMNKF